MALGDLTTAAVDLALSEFDRLGRAAFLKKYGFRRARGYYIERNGLRYDSKAVAGAAHGYLGRDHLALRPDEFSGGNATVVKVLRSLGFTLKVDLNPDWNRDELILALELYLKPKGKTLNQNAEEVVQLSATLNALAARMGASGAATFRNPNGVHMKLMNFRRLDPLVGGGLSRGNGDEEHVWDTYAHDPDLLNATAETLRAHIESTEKLLEISDDEEDYEASEGKLLTRVHKTRERDKELVKKRKSSALRKHGSLVCEACGFDFGVRYGGHGLGFIEAHHVRPLHTIGERGSTKASELALLCSNCHRMVHRQRPWLTIEELKAIIGGATSV